MFDRETGEFQEQSSLFVPTMPLEPLAEIYSLPKPAVYAWMACHFLHRWNRGAKFKLNRKTASRFGLTVHMKRRALVALEKAGFIDLERSTGASPFIKLTSKSLG